MLFRGLDYSSLPDLPRLPLYHTMRFGSVISEDNIMNQENYLSIQKKGIYADPEKCKRCDIFGKYLVYLFYGRPAFRWDDKDVFPVFFVFSRNNAVVPDSVFPFDSGAFNRNLYVVGTKPAYSSSQLEDYQLSSASEGLRASDIPRLIGAIWENNLYYYNGEYPCSYSELLDKMGDRLSEFDKEYLSFIFQGKNDGESYGKSDSRAFTIEYIVQDILSLESLERVYVPNSISFLEQISLQERIEQACGHPIEIRELSSKSVGGNELAAFDQMMEEGRQFTYTY